MPFMTKQKVLLSGFFSHFLSIFAVSMSMWNRRKNTAFTRLVGSKKNVGLHEILRGLKKKKNPPPNGGFSFSFWAASGLFVSLRTQRNIPYVHSEQRKQNLSREKLPAISSNICMVV